MAKNDRLMIQKPLQQRTNKVTGSFRHPAIFQVISTNIFHPRNSVGRRYMSSFDPMPLETIALAGAVVSAFLLLFQVVTRCLTKWLCMLQIENGLHELLYERTHGVSKAVSFDGALYGPSWTAILNSLRSYADRKPFKCADLQADIIDNAKSVCRAPTRV